MIRNGFSDLADAYDTLATAEAAAGERLLDLVAIGPRDFVLDVGCGTGTTTFAARRRCQGKIVGIDVSAGMIRRARWHPQQPDVSFVLGDAAAMEYERNFNVVILNSSLHWMADPVMVLERCFHALRRGGWLGLQVPATGQWCPLAQAVLKAVREEKALAAVASRFRDPMLIPPDLQSLEQTLDRAVIDVYGGSLATDVLDLTAEEALGVVEVQLGAALFNPACYDGGLTQPDHDRLRALAREVVADATDGAGRVSVTITRAYMHGSKQWNERRLTPAG
ncbi:methyltransferase domain-containing protein [Novispirillum sp. DQ9]|uniref:methyltransferase domain-containing protein n=1 Tax=Novispirillum sp. DQ9 TaxID=3398612 RepID=UPI003C7ADD43